MSGGSGGGKRRFFFFIVRRPHPPSQPRPPPLFFFPRNKKNIPNQEPLEATIWAHDRASGGLVLASAGSTPLVHNIRVTSESAVAKVLSAEAPAPPPSSSSADGEKASSSSSSSQAADAAAAAGASHSSSSFFDPLAKLPELDEAKCRERLSRAVEAAAARAAKIGVGVSRRAQAAFDALDKTLPCAWGETEADRGTIYVLEREVAVKGPGYDSASASVVVEGGGEGGGASAASAEGSVEASKARQALERVRMVLDAAKDELPPP